MLDQSATDFFLPPDLVARALASLAERCENQADGLDAQDDRQLTAAERAMPGKLRREASSFRAALDYWQSGYKPIIMADGSYLIASRSGSGALFHTIRKIDGRWAKPSPQADDVITGSRRASSISQQSRSRSSRSTREIMAELKSGS